MSATKKKRAGRLKPEQIALMQALIRDEPHLTNLQIAELCGASDTSVALERRGIRNPIEASKKAAFERVKARLSANKPGLPSMEDEPVPAPVDGRMPEMRSDTFSHPEKTAAQVEAEILKKATLAVHVAKAMLKTGSDAAVEDQATRLLQLSDEDLVATYMALVADAQDEDDNDKPLPIMARIPSSQAEAFDQAEHGLKLRIRRRALRLLSEQLDKCEGDRDFMEPADLSAIVKGLS